MRQVFDEALDRPEAERLVFLETACAGDATLFREVQRLLHARDASKSFLERDSARPPRIGRYLIQGELGRGAMGVVYDAVDPMIGRRVAVKVIRLEALTEPNEAEFLRERLFREARSAGQLFHPGIIIIFDVGQHRESAFIAMERVEGPTLQQVLAPGRPVDSSEVLRILQQTAAALDYAHHHGIVHRDIKPANIMLQDGVTVKVADFGIAKIMSAQLTTVQGLVMGTPSYMSPEQIEARPVDGRSDQFSLAVLAYELLTGTKPFEADSIATLAHLIVYGPRPLVRTRNPALPLGLEQVFQRGFRRLPEERFGSCAEFVAALDGAFQQQLVQEAAPPPVPQRAKYRRKRTLHKFLSVAGIAGVLVVLALAVVPYKSFHPRAEPNRPKPVQPSTAGAVAPVVKKFSADPPFVEAGKRATLNWDVSGAKEVTIDQGIGRVAASGRLAVVPTISTKYTLTANDLTNNVSASASVGVRPQSAPVVPSSIRAQQFYDDGVAKRHEGRLEDAVALFRQAADLGDPDAMVELGESYRAGEGVTQDDSEALRWFRRAADAGNSAGMLSIGAMYLLGDGIPASDDEAVQWFEKAAARGNPAGIYDLATMYEGGRGVTQNLDKANELYQKAAGLGNREAQRHLAQTRSRSVQSKE